MARQVTNRKFASILYAYKLERDICLSVCLQERKLHWKKTMAYRNENGFPRAMNMTASPSTTANVSAANNDRPVKSFVDVFFSLNFLFVKLLDRHMIQELAKEIDPNLQTDEEVEDV